MQTAVSVERQITKNANIAVSYLNSQGRTPVPDAQHQCSAAGDVRPERSRPAAYGRLAMPRATFTSTSRMGTFEQNQLIVNANVQDWIEGVAVRLVHVQ